MGLALADEIVAVSPSYSKEITTPQFGYGLEKLLLERRKSIFGILNGIDYQKWDPQTDKCVDNPYSVKTILKRLDNKHQIQKQFGLVYRNNQIPLVTIISRLDIQKGIDLLIEGFMSLKAIPMQLIILGIGNKLIEKDCIHLENKFPRKVRAVIRYDGSTARKLYGGADMILIPSRFEPCGTTQMIAMRYGCIPIARATGGLKDSIQNEKNGFLFKDATALALFDTLIKAINIFQNEPDRWRKIQIKAMNSDFSWNNSALLYVRRYIHLLSD
jgi:starch synthase